MELLLLGIFAAVLLLCVFTGFSIIYAMLLGLVMFFSYGLIKKKTWKQMLIFSWQGVKTAKNILLTSVVTVAVSCNQTLSIMLTNQLCGENNPEK